MDERLQQLMEESQARGKGWLLENEGKPIFSAIPHPDGIQIELDKNIIPEAKVYLFQAIVIALAQNNPGLVANIFNELFQQPEPSSLIQ